MENIREMVRDRYGEIAKSKTSCCGPVISCCVTGKAADMSKSVGIQGTPYLIHFPDIKMR